MSALGTLPKANVGPKLRWEKLNLGTECKGCGKLFPTAFAYDQHRCSPALRIVRNLACGYRTEVNRINVTAVPRANMSTASVERRPAPRRSRGECHIKHITHILCMYITNLKTGGTRCGYPALLDLRQVIFSIKKHF